MNVTDKDGKSFMVIKTCIEVPRDALYQVVSPITWATCIDRDTGKVATLLIDGLQADGY